MSDSDSSVCSSSYEESESSSERAWTCDDIYPTKPAAGGKAAVVDDSSSYDDSSVQSDSSGDSFAAAPPAKNTPAKTVDSSESSEDDSESRIKKKVDQLHRASSKAERPSLKKHSSADIAAVIDAQENVLKRAEAEEKKRQALLNMNRESLRQRSEEVLNISRHLEEELNNVCDEFDSSDEAMKNIEKQIEEKRNSTSSMQQRKEHQDKMTRRNIEREMRLAKARERIEKKKEEEAKKQEEKIMDEKNNAGKLDMSKAARVERAYSWYTRMAMPTRDKMKERVEFMPASSGVTPDDVDLLPWNARGTFVSVAAMMRMNRTASQSGGKKKADDSDSDSD